MSHATVLTNGRIWTGDRFAHSATVVGNRILAVNEPAPAGARELDLGGRLAVPGFIDNHVHFVASGASLANVQLRDAASPEEFARRIAAHAAKLGPGAWVTGGGWDEQLWQPYTLPARQMIDDVTRANPVFVSRLDIHMGLANSVALELAGITRNTPDPPGGTIVRDAQGEPTGLLKDAAMAAVTAVIPSLSIEQRIDAARAGMAEAARFGVTSFCDMAITAEAFDDFRAYQRLERGGELTARVWMYMPVGAWERLRDAALEKSFGSERLHIAGLKGFADGSLGSSTAAFREPFTDEPHNCGLLMAPMADRSMHRWVSAADEHELQIALHAIGDRANAEVLDLFETRPQARQRRFRVEHAQHLDDALIRRFAESRVVASMQPYHAIDDGRWAETKVGAERARYTYAFRSLIDAGAVVTFGSDWNVAPLNPLLGIYAAVTRRTLDGRHPHGWIPEQRLTVEQAMRCYTVNNAWAVFAENAIGRIAPGFLADIAVLSRDIFTIPPEEIADAKVEMTMFDGRVICEG